jgi:undecaprenyl-diphosphatase
MSFLEHLDRSLFVLIQHAPGHALLDPVMMLIREPLTWVPLYAFMLYYAIRVRKWRAWAFIILSVVTFAITDSVTAQVLKPLFGRPRPCHDPEMQAVLRGLIPCGGLYSMPSNHAANHFALASFWYLSVRLMRGRKWWWLWVWAAIICYAQVYVGKHYPFDVLVGALFGTLTGVGMYRLFVYWEKRQGLISSASI